MNRPPLFAFIAIGLLLLLPAGAGRLLLDLAGGLLVVLLMLPVLLGGLGWVGWKVLQTRMQTCLHVVPLVSDQILSAAFAVRPTAQKLRQTNRLAFQFLRVI
jgi:hypothetical protein